MDPALFSFASSARIYSTGETKTCELLSDKACKCITREIGELFKVASIAKAFYRGPAKEAA